MPIPIPYWIFASLEPRAVLLLNHLLMSEPAAMLRLQPHAGRRLQWDCAAPPGWPLPASLVLCITPAGLAERVDVGPSADLRITLDATQPASLLKSLAQGQRPPIEVSGDAALASDISWLFDHLRWDIEDDLALLLGPMVAHELVRRSTTMARGVREAVQKLSALRPFTQSGTASPT